MNKIEFKKLSSGLPYLMKVKKCKSCKKETSNPKFCSRSCSAKFNNKKFPKRHPEGNCKSCNKKISVTRTYCKPCFKDIKLVDWSEITLKEVKGKRRYQKHSRIRTLAREEYLKSSKPKKCIVCGYDKIFHVCHVKAINAFDLDSKISEINSISNLIALCPNHHWEFDNNLLKI